MYADLKAPTGVTDLIVVTDALCTIPGPVRESFLAWKRAAQVRAIALVVDHPAGDLAAVADEVHSVRSLDADEDAVGRVLAL